VILVSSPALPPPPHSSFVPPPPPSTAPASYPAFPQTPGTMPYVAPVQQGIVRRTATESERQILARIQKQQRTAGTVVAVIGLVCSTLYYAVYPGFLLLIFAMVFVFVGLGLTGTVYRARKAGSKAEVVEIHGLVEKFGDTGPGARKGQTYSVQIGADRVTVPLAVYDKFAPRMPGSLTIVEAMHQAIAVNGEPLVQPAAMRWVSASSH